MIASIYLLLSTTACLAESTPGATQILKWPDGKKACFVLAFDDGAPSQLKNVIPELEKRKIVGTFYLVTGNSLYASLKSKWEAAVQSPYVVVANHTFTHKGVTEPGELEPELAKNNEVLLGLFPDRKPRLLAFGRPGGVPWVVTREEVATALARHHLVERPPFFGPPIHYKNMEAVLGVVDRALEKGEMEHLDFHGVGGDWLVTPLEWFIALLDKLGEKKDVLWITDTISWHKYLAERTGAAARTVESTADRIRVELTVHTDPALYDLPLTLSTAVPKTWKDAVVTQGTVRATRPVKDGVVQYPALPGGGTISLQLGTAY